jgi:hypothetical protein
MYVATTDARAHYVRDTYARTRTALFVISTHRTAEHASTYQELSIDI